MKKLKYTQSFTIFLLTLSRISKWKVTNGITKRHKLDCNRMPVKILPDATPSRRAEK